MLRHLICSKCSLILENCPPDSDTITLHVVGTPKRDYTESCFWPATKITIPAVKITGDAPALPLNFDDTILPPQPCLSDSLKIEPIENPLFPVLNEAEATPMLSTDPEAEFGEFLLDAVDWL